MVPSLTRQIRQVREMTVFFLRPKEGSGPPSLASCVSSVPKGRAPQGERPERTSLPPHAEAGMPEAAPPDFVPSGQESAEALRNLRRGAGFLRPPQEHPKAASPRRPLRPRAESADRFTTPSAESCLSRQRRKDTTSCPFSGRASRFSPRGKHESGALDGGLGFRPEQERR